MPRCRAGWTSCARALAGMRSRRSRPPPSTKMPGFFASRPSLRIRPANGSPRNGRYARSAISPRRSEWERRSPMPGGMPFSRWSALPEKMISMRRISVALPKAGVEQPPRSDHRSQSNGHAAAAERPPRKGGKPSVRSARPILSPEQSAILRERLVAQLAAINSSDDAAALGASQSCRQEHANRS